MNNPVTRVLMLSSFGAYAFIYVPGVVLLALDIKYPNSEWVNSLLLVLAGLSAVLWVVVNRGIGRGIGFAGAVLLLSFAVEYLGVRSGLIFGPYQYTTVLTPLLLTVPLAIPFAWLTVVLASWYVANAITSARANNGSPLQGRSRANNGSPLQVKRFSFITPHSSLLTLVVAGLLTMLLDLLIEPVAVHVSGYWLWQRGGVYYGIPAQNFIAWAVIGGLMALLAARLIGNPASRPAFAFLPPALYIMNALLFGVVAFAHGYIVTGLLAALALTLGGRALVNVLRIRF
ncbi:MAG: hypothetical protein DLM69_04650 [Candidatus Chloroheliales bacterium]|nr:MAG: hypothetical protein DLM69_04650 [Chloroflexota bacterium]